MLEVGVAIEVLRGLLGVLVLHHVNQEVAHGLAIDLSHVKVACLGHAVDLGVSGGVGLLCEGGKVVPVLGDEAIAIETEHVESHLLTGSSEVVHGVQENFVAVLVGADVLYRRLCGCRGQVLHAAHEGVAAGAVGQVVLNVAFSQERGCLFGVAGGEGLDECESVLDLYGHVDSFLPSGFAPLFCGSYSANYGVDGIF